jgi:hypothetical protein
LLSKFLKFVKISKNGLKPYMCNLSGLVGNGLLLPQVLNLTLVYFGENRGHLAFLKGF